MTPARGGVKRGCARGTRSSSLPLGSVRIMTPPGPASLGRGVVVGPSGPTPGPWAEAPEVVIDETALARPEAAVTALHRAWSARTPVTVRLVVDGSRFRAPRSYDAEPWTLDAHFEVWEDRLQFLVWANNYDARSDVDDPVWWWARKAQRLGASVPGASGTGEDHVADIVLPDGQPAWVDGGPRAPLSGADLGGAVIVHRESLERDRLAVAPVVVSATERYGGELAPDQLAAVAHPSGPARIIAPAGSGKTRVLTTRLRHLVVDRRWDRDAVLAVAYNKKAQQELDARCADFAPRTRTLNSLGLSILARARGRSPGVLEPRDTRRIVERLAPQQRRRVNTDPIGPYLEALGSVRLGLRDPEEVEASRDDVPGLAAMWPGFRAELRDLEAVDFDEQVYGAIEALLADGALRANEQLACRHLLVDELQDLTPAHVLLLRLLAAPVLDCFGVGDDDQVIYGHAGADPDFLINFERLFPSAGDHPLEVNYRCPAPVVEAAVHLLSYNHRRVPKRIRAAKAEYPDIHPPGGGSEQPGPDDAAPGLTGSHPGLQLRVHPGGAGAADLAGVVTGWVDAGHAPSTIAVLSRVNSMLLAPHIALVEAGVPVESVVQPDLLARTGLRAALAYLRIATAAEGHIAGRDIVEILRRPSRGLPPWFSDRLRRRSGWSVKGLLDIIATVPDKDAVKVERLVDDIVAIRAAAQSGTKAARLLQLVRVDIGLGGAMGLLDGGRGGEGASHVDDLEALEQVARLHEDPASLEAWLSDHLERPADRGGVVVSTVHRVKGMEWDRVAVYGVTAGIVPHRLADDEEEERRVLHVGITRGREEVAVFSDATRPSPFVDELIGAAPHAPPGPRPSTAGGGATGAPARRAVGVGQAGGGRSGPSSKGAAVEVGPPGDPALEDALRAWRRQRSTQDAVPAYVVFADRTLRAIASARPATLAALRTVDGIGPTKLELYGEDILALVADAPRSPDLPP
jgi:DNA helicase-2/ATP-dependent DNA helicase PcrA